MNPQQVSQFVKTVTSDIQAKISRKRTKAPMPLASDRYDAAAAINQKMVGSPSRDKQDKTCKMAFDNMIQYIIKV